VRCGEQHHRCYRGKTYNARHQHKAVHHLILVDSRRAYRNDRRSMVSVSGRSMLPGCAHVVIVPPAHGDALRKDVHSASPS
jgi:hypothetical protein